MKVALVHDWLVSSGGGERVLYLFHCLFPEAPIYTLVYDPERAPEWTKDCDIRTTYMQRWPGARHHHKMLLSFMPQAWESLDMASFDLVLSSCSSCCKGIITRSDAIHICYCHTPTRYVWDMYYEYYDRAGWLKKAFMPSMIHKVRMWDYLAAQRVDYFLANSKYVAQRIRKFYGKEAQVIYPGAQKNPLPVKEKREDFYLVVSRLVPYKRIDLAVQACTALNKKLVVVGTGEEENNIKKLAGPTIEFRGNANNEEVWDLYSRAKAFLFPGLEDFGITPVEAMSAGCPVIAYGKGGALETVIDGVTGLFFEEQKPESLAHAIIKFESMDSLSTKKMIEQASRFSDNSFCAELLQAIESACCGHTK